MTERTSSGRFPMPSIRPLLVTIPRSWAAAYHLERSARTSPWGPDPRIEPGDGLSVVMVRMFGFLIDHKEKSPKRRAENPGIQDFDGDDGFHFARLPDRLREERRNRRREVVSVDGR